jgi:hypothetical protein
VYPLVRIYHRAILWWFHKHLSFALVELVYRWFRASTQHGVGPLLSHVVMISCDFMYPSCLIYPRECHLHSCQTSFRSWSLTLMEAVSISVKLNKGLLYLEHSMKLSDKEDWVINATWSESLKCSITHPQREKVAGDAEKFFSFQLSRYPLFYFQLS